jgi:glutathione synthase/RimK-type ligase-like ATP-grasp enzyme
VLFFFPYKYWNRNIEVYQDNRVYGGEKFGRKFKDFFKDVKRSINGYYSGKKIKYVNSPEACWRDRDKKASKDLLHRRGIPTPRTFQLSSFTRIQQLRKNGINLYLKPRFGALGKGIVYVDREGVNSNLPFHKGRVVSKPYYYNKWRFAAIKPKDERRFFNRILKKGFVCEQAIEPPVYRKRRFDFRVYVLFGKVVYLYARSSPEHFCVTNWTQGGRIDKRKVILKSLPAEKIERVKRLAKRAARALELNYAGIDIILSRNLKKAYVLEGNAFPGYEKGFDLMKSLLKHI